MIKFSLLMCVYEKENPLHLKACLESINAQTVMPDEVVIVKDGPLTPELEEILESYRLSQKQLSQKQKSPINVNIIALPENVTSGPARAASVEAASYDWVAVMDSDDICKPDRFEKQLKMIEENPELGLIGGQIAEFVDDPEVTSATRTVPTNHDDIVRFAKFRSPFSQMTVMFKREAALDAGNYRYFLWFEDYDLWTRMINNGTICANHPDVLVDARIGSGMYGRRRGVRYIKSEWRMQKQLRDLGIINGFEFIRNIVLRIPVRILPGRCLELLYRGFTRE